MKLADYISALQQILENVGSDCEVWQSKYGPMGAAKRASRPTVAYMKVRNKRESTDKFHSYITDTPDERGIVVVKIG